MTEEQKNHIDRGWSFFKKKNGDIRIVRLAEVEDIDGFKLLVSEFRPKYAIIRFRAPMYALFAVARNVPLACAWAEKNNMIPIIWFDWGYILKEYINGDVETENFWDYIFKQNYDVREALKDDCFVGDVSRAYTHDSEIRERILGNKDDKIIRAVKKDYKKYYSHIFEVSRKWLNFKDDILEEFIKIKDRIFESEMKILGVPLREEFAAKGEDRAETYRSIHPTEPDLSEIIELIKEYMSNWNCTHVFVATMYSSSIERLKDVFGNRLIFSERTRVDYSDFINNTKKFARDITSMTDREMYSCCMEVYSNMGSFNSYDKSIMKEYSLETWLVSQCDCFLGGESGYSIMANVLNGGRYDQMVYLENRNKTEDY